MSQEARRKAIAEAVEAHEDGHETLRLQWQGEGQLFPVVKVPIEAVLLNPKSHRIRAQLESHPDREEIESDPFSETSQEKIADLLRLDEGYDPLKTNLQMVGQRDPGVITREAVLVNANRRVVCLRDIRESYLRVAVLPPNATQEEIDRLELQLQVARDYRRDYSYTNELLFVDELLTKHNHTPNEVALELGWAASEETRELRKGKNAVEAATRQLSLIREIQQISQGAIPITFFDDERVALEEIDTQYESLRTTDPEMARRVRDMRFLAILTDVQYRYLRLIDATYLTEYLMPAMEESDSATELSQALRHSSAPGGQSDDPEGLDVLGAEDPSSEAEDVPDPAPILEALARSEGAESVVLSIGNGETAELNRERVIDALQTSVESAAEDKSEDQKAAGRLEAPLDNLRKADRHLKRATEKYSDVKGAADFDTEGFTGLFERVQRSFEALADTIEPD